MKYFTCKNTSAYILTDKDFLKQTHNTITAFNKINLDQGLNPHPLQQKHEVLTTGLPGTSLASLNNSFWGRFYAEIELLKGSKPLEFLETGSMEPGGVLPRQWGRLATMQMRQGLTFDEFSISSLSSADTRSEEGCKCKRDCGIIPQTGISAP